MGCYYFNLIDYVSFISQLNGIYLVGDDFPDRDDIVV